MKTPKIGLLIFAVIVLLTGCLNPSPALYTPHTNVVDEVVVLVTNPVTGAITLNTNQVLEVTYGPNTNTLAAIKDAGTLVDRFVPGVGTLGSAGVGAILALVGQLFYKRYTKKK